MTTGVAGSPPIVPNALPCSGSQPVPSGPKPGREEAIVLFGHWRRPTASVTALSRRFGMVQGPIFVGMVVLPMLSGKASGLSGWPLAVGIQCVCRLGPASNLVQGHSPRRAKPSCDLVGVYRARSHQAALPRNWKPTPRASGRRLRCRAYRVCPALGRCVEALLPGCLTMLVGVPQRSCRLQVGVRRLPPNRWNHACSA